jgi:hypothetical protein
VSKKHASRATRLHEWAKLGNIDRRFQAALSNLTDLRSASRYLAGSGETAGRARAIAVQRNLDDFEQHVIDSASKRAGGRGLRDRVIVEAWQDIKAGSPVTWGVDSGMGRPPSEERTRAAVATRAQLGGRPAAS